MAVKKRCNFCGKVLRADGTCANPNCPRYVPEENAQPKQDSATDTNDGGK
jgi:phage FluMu protein Com